jgi:hypothetical protein
MFEKINFPATDFIGNTLSSTNTNYSNLEIWTNSISFSSKKLYEPLVNFYLFYGDFWKDTIEFAYSIDAPSRLTSFYTNIETNSSLWIDPFVFFYPQILPESARNQTTISTVKDWINQKFPVTTNSQTAPVYLEKTPAIVYVMFYNENTRVPQAIDVDTKNITCNTNDVSVTVTCRTTWGGANVTCGASGNVCAAISPTVCTNTKTAKCLYENDQQTKVRTGTANINVFFNDRYESNDIYAIKLIVNSCEWQFEKLL